MPHKFTGKFITLPEYSKTKPVNVFHRQLQKCEIPKTGIPENLHVLCRAEFRAEKPEKTIIYITADDYYKLYINGRYVSQGPAPAFSFKYYYNEIDITDYIKPGRNVIAVHALYQGLINRVWVSGDGRLGLIFDVESGGEIICCSDKNVKCAVHDGFTALSVTGYATQFMERYDSRSDKAGFERIDYDCSKWQNAAECIYSDHVLVPQPSRQLVFETIKPKTTKRSGNTIKVDFGGCHVGYLNLEAAGNPGDRIIIRCAQELNADGSIRYRLRANCIYEEDWLLSGGIDKLDQFDYKSFRYAEITLPDGAEIKDISLTARHYPFEEYRKCKSDDPVLQRIWNLCSHSLEYGVQEVIQDCMEREKGQYLGDGCFTSCSYAVLTGDLAIMEKLIDNAFDTAFINAGLMTCFPCSFMQEIAEYVLMLPHLLLAHAALSGSADFASGYYDKMASALDYYRDNYEREVLLLYDLDKWCVVDWPDNCRDGYAFNLSEGRIAEGTHSVINAYYVGAVKAMNRLAGITGRPPYRDAEPLAAAYRENFFDKENRRFTDIPMKANAAGDRHSALPSNSFALCFGLCPDAETEENIISMIMSRPATNMAFFGTFAALIGLKRLGREEEIIKLLKNEDRWLRMLDEGADVTYEAWGRDVKWNTSLFHLCYTYPILFLCDWGIEQSFS